ELSRSEFQQATQIEANRNIELIKKRTLEAAIKEVKGVDNRPIQLITIDVEGSQTVGTLLTLLNNSILDRISKKEQYSPQSKIMQESANRIAEIKSALLSALGLA